MNDKANLFEFEKVKAKSGVRRSEQTDDNYYTEKYMRFLNPHGSRISSLKFASDLMRRKIM